VVLIGHSQGTFNLIELAAEEIDPKKRKARKKLVSALLLGGNVTVADGQDAGGDFRRIRACRSRKQLGCVVAFSTFNGPVPANAVFGRTSEPGREVLCTNPAALGGGSAPLRSTRSSRASRSPPGTIAGTIAALGLPTPSVSTPWIEYPGAFSGQCSSARGPHEPRAQAGEDVRQEARVGAGVTPASIARIEFAHAVRPIRLLMSSSRLRATSSDARNLLPLPAAAEQAPQAAG
jgi:hypothetical protein